MKEVQLKRIKEIQKTWANMGTIYNDIIFHNGIVYMLLENGTAFSINERGQGIWVTSGWENGKSIVERPSGRLMLELTE